MAQVEFSRPFSIGLGSIQAGDCVVDILSLDKVSQEIEWAAVRVGQDDIRLESMGSELIFQAIRLDSESPWSAELSFKCLGSPQVWSLVLGSGEGQEPRHMYPVRLQPTCGGPFRVGQCLQTIVTGQDSTELTFSVQFDQQDWCVQGRIEGQLRSLKHLHLIPLRRGSLLLPTINLWRPHQSSVVPAQSNGQFVQVE